MNPIAQLLTDLLNMLTGGISGSIGPLIGFIGNTPLALTTANPVIGGAWTTMVAVADVFLGLLVTVKAMQVMYGQSVGALYLPVSQFVPRAILTAILIHLSLILGQDLILLNNALCALVRADVMAFINQVNGGQFTGGQGAGISAVLGIVFAFSLLRVILQALKRIVFFNVLFVLSGPAFLMSFDAQTAPWFAFWARTYVVTIFTQFFQFLTFGLGFQFLIASKLTGPTGFLLAIAMLNLTAEIPGLLSRFATSAGASAGGIGSVVRSAIMAGALFV